MNGIHKIGYNANNPIFVRINLAKLEAIQKQLGRKFVAEVGILGDKNARNAMGKLRKSGGHTINKKQASPLTNAAIGLKHEKGSYSEKIPRRSFLEMPLKNKLPDMMGRIGGQLLVGIKASNILLAYQKLGLIGERIVLQAFNSSGYGEWQANSAFTISLKHSSRPLIDTGQLRRSISSRVATK